MDRGKTESSGSGEDDENNKIDKSAEQKKAREENEFTRSAPLPGPSAFQLHGSLPTAVRLTFLRGSSAIP
ncbi:hypothetical protein BDR04DRAFT_1085623 [Suillus decipiens]|nr:hypothetical protein BDR04DRAFT_1085623 [Suillus decipiens]